MQGICSRFKDPLSTLDWVLYLGTNRGGWRVSVGNITTILRGPNTIWHWIDFYF